MNTRSCFRLIALSGLLLILTACQVQSFSSSAASVASVPAGESLYVIDGYSSTNNSSAGQRIVAFQPTNAKSASSVTLPVGLTSLDHKRLYTATVGQGQTTISVMNTQTGATIRSFAVSGTYSTAQWGYDNAIASADGRWLALRELGKASGATTIALINTQSGTLAKKITLSGDFTLDALAPDASRLYLLRRITNWPGHYNVMLYDLTQNQLNPYPIVDKNLPQDIMSGSALARQMSSDGSIAYTLYVNPVSNLAFVHILPLHDSYIGARCIDLPVGKTTALLRYYTFALSSDGSTLYVANSALGIVVKIGLHGGEVFYDTIERSNHFSPGNFTTDTSRTLYNGAVLSADQSMLYVAGVEGIWAIRTSDLKVQAHYLSQQAISSVALDASGKTLYAVGPTSGITLLDTGTGQTQQEVQGPVHIPWGIAWINN